ncbi:hypothetical protein SteCoe_11322 [Stentor coeruleus]|uniref:non-specific serine/threonine protein kinase n=1 Tax=Stentor coeruleus TaxID=5963 RepID=A0A1R2CDI7_9CILI|nr:hypothetical protein SteCoe_11322 [Stentor coeruleus]
MGCTLPKCTGIQEKGKKYQKKLHHSKSQISLNETCSSQLADYISVEGIGTGAYSEVLVCKHSGSKSFRAMKIIKKYKLHKQHFHKSGDLIESNILDKLDHKHILKYYETIEDNSYYYLITELCKGGTLYARLKGKKQFPEKICLYIMYQILLAIEYLHSKSIIHRDIKPENIFMVDSESYDLKLADFGNSCMLSKSGHTSGCFGSAYYLAPEVLKGIYNCKVDIWSCGILLYALLTGKAPYKTKDKIQIKKCVLESPFQIEDAKVSMLSEDVQDLMKKMLSIDPKKRISAKNALEHPWIKAVNK